MAGYDLPRSADIGGKTYEIRSDYRAVIDIMTVVSDPDLTDAERATMALGIFYPQADSIPREHAQDALDYMFWFVSGGESPPKKRKPRVMDWEQDFPLIVSPVNRSLGFEVRGVEYLHWWTFLAAYREIGDCTFAQVVSIRKKKMAGKKLDRAEAQFYADNREIVDLRRLETQAERDIFEEWT